LEERSSFSTKARKKMTWGPGAKKAAKKDYPEHVDASAVSSSPLASMNQEFIHTMDSLHTGAVSTAAVPEVPPLLIKFAVHMYLVGKAAS
jgi:hypothetical protein